MDPNLLLALLGMLGQGGNSFSPYGATPQSGTNGLLQMLSSLGLFQNNYDQSLGNQNYYTAPGQSPTGVSDIGQLLSMLLGSQQQQQQPTSDNAASILFQYLFGPQAQQQAINYQQTQPAPQFYNSNNPPPGQFGPIAYQAPAPAGGGGGGGAEYDPRYPGGNPGAGVRGGYIPGHNTEPYAPTTLTTTPGAFNQIGRVPTYGQLPPGVIPSTDPSATFGVGGGAAARYSPWMHQDETPAMASDWDVRNQIQNRILAAAGMDPSQQTLLTPSDPRGSLARYNLYKQQMEAAGLGDLVGPLPPWLQGVTPADNLSGDIFMFQGRPIHPPPASAYTYMGGQAPADAYVAPQYRPIGGTMPGTSLQPWTSGVPSGSASSPGGGTSPAPGDPLGGLSPFAPPRTPPPAGDPLGGLSPFGPSRRRPSPATVDPFLGGPGGSAPAGGYAAPPAPTWQKPLPPGWTWHPTIPGMVVSPGGIPQSADQMQKVDPSHTLYRSPAAAPSFTPVRAVQTTPTADGYSPTFFNPVIQTPTRAGTGVAKPVKSLGQPYWDAKQGRYVDPVVEQYKDYYGL